MTATGSQPLAYQWRKDGTNLVDGGRITGVTNPCVTLANIAASDVGEYSVVITNALTSATSAPALLALQAPPPPVIIGQPQDLVIAVSNAASFSVTATGAPPLLFQWRLADTNLPGATSSNFAVASAQFSDAGPYSVVVSNPSGSVTSAPAVLTVMQPPSFTVQPQSQTVFLSNTATFTVSVSGGSPISLQWTFNGTNIAAATGSSFTRLGSQVADAGTYTVAVTNIAGAVVSSNAVLMVAVPLPPHFDLISLLPDQRVDVWLSGSTGIVYVIEASTNLFDWAPLATLTNTSGAFEFIDNPATNAQRLYRARLGP